LSAELFLMPYSEAPGDLHWVTPESRDRIMHSTLRQGDLELLMAADTMPGTPFHQGNFAVVIECETYEEIDTLFKALSVGGEVAMPLQDMFWNARFGMINDKFGIHWMLNYALPKQA
ncbi:MAG: VOC family protein, partial [Silvibacterium sp.]